jgi:hypothetical protein
MGNRWSGLCGWGLAWVVSFPLLACGNASDPENGDEDPAPSETLDVEQPEKDFTTVELEYKSDAAVLDDVSAVQAALRSANYDAGELVFEADYEGLTPLEPGSSALIGGVGIFRVLGKEATDEGVLVRVEPAPLTDVLDNATIAWRRSFVSAFARDGLGLGVDEDQTENIRRLRQPLGTFEDGNLSFSGAIGPFATSFELSPGPDGLDFEMSAKATADFERGDLQSFGANAIANAAMSGTLHAFTQTLNMKIEGGVVTGYDLRVEVSGDVSLEAGAVELGGETKLQIPARLALPVLIGPIPFRVELGGSLEIATTLTANTSALVKGHSKFRAYAGPVIEGAEVRYAGALETADLVLDKAENVATIDSGATFLLNFPEVTVGVGFPKLLDASAAVRFKTEVISNISLRYEAAGNFPVITGNCLSSRTNFGASYGGDVKFLGFTLPVLEETQIFGKLGTLSQTGEACE